ncbi:hypothetical protein B0T14DRAFT_499947 [Immersiella caudata]|uniref:NTF2-like domain-containing protein n=1 Tax=Immersiella caudata TaxID=314043 RepID=A0AA39WG42_9PEZI|nr:hypothetical protein B0T14DRAFT_499947 [Immersiella caudata]
MQLKSLVLAAAMLGVSHGWALPSIFSRQAKCMTAAETTEMVEIYRKLIAEYTEELGEKYVHADFVDYSDSINTFIHLPLGGPSFPDRATFLDVQSWNMHFPMKILSVDAVQCNTVALQWQSQFGDANLPSKGLTIMKTLYNAEAGHWQVQEIIVEFNALTWLLNMGGSYEWEGETWTPERPDPSILAPPKRKLKLRMPKSLPQN